MDIEQLAQKCVSEFEQQFINLNWHQQFVFKFNNL